MPDSFLDFLRARVADGNEAEADAILAEHFKGHEKGLAAYTQACESAQQIAHLMKPAGLDEVQAELAKILGRHQATEMSSQSDSD